MSSPDGGGKPFSATSALAFSNSEMVREGQKSSMISASSCRPLPCSRLTIGQQQLVATARASTRGTRFLIFDEPTAYLTRQRRARA